MFAFVMFHLWEVGAHISCIGAGDDKPRVYFCFCEVGFDFFGTIYLCSCLDVSVFGRRLRSETVTPTGHACISNFD